MDILRKEKKGMHTFSEKYMSVWPFLGRLYKTFQRN